MSLFFPVPDGVDQHRRLDLVVGKDRWTFRVVPLGESEARRLARRGLEVPEEWVTVSKNGRYLSLPELRPDRWFPEGDAFTFWRPRIASPYPLIAIRRGDIKMRSIRFLRIVRGRLQIMGDAPEIQSNGPVLWKGRREFWLFDNENPYDMRIPGWARKYRLYQIGRNGRLRLMREWKVARDAPLPDTVGE